MAELLFGNYDGSRGVVGRTCGAAARILVRERKLPQCPETERHLEQIADDVVQNEVQNQHHGEAVVTFANVEHVVGDEQRRSGEDHTDTADREEQQRFVMPFAPAAILERPFPVEDVTQDRGQDAGNNLGDSGLLLQYREAEGVEDCEIENHGRAAHDGELDEFVVTDRQSPQWAGEAIDHAVDRGHSGEVYETGQ